MTTRVTVRDGAHTLTDVVRDGESWRSAAVRTAGSLSGVPHPIDLSGATKVFAIDHDWVVTLRAMTHGDLSQVTAWRQQPHLHRWWKADGRPSLERVSEQYGADIDGTTPTRIWIAEVNGRSVGFVQDYRISDYPEYALLAPDPDAIGVDYAIGPPEWVGRGLGLRIMWSWMLTARHRFPDAAAYFAAPDHRNRASVRMLDKLGFNQGLWFDEPAGDGSTSTVIGCTVDVARVLG